MSILKTLDTETGQIMLSMILGLGLASLFRRVCTDEKCVIYTPPEANKIDNLIFTQNGKCFKYAREIVNC